MLACDRHNRTESIHGGWSLEFAPFSNPSFPRKKKKQEHHYNTGNDRFARPRTRTIPTCHESGTCSPVRCACAMATAVRSENGVCRFGNFAWGEDAFLWNLGRNNGNWLTYHTIGWWQLSPRSISTIRDLLVRYEMPNYSDLEKALRFLPRPEWDNKLKRNIKWQTKLIKGTFSLSQLDTNFS